MHLLCHTSARHFPRPRARRKGGLDGAVETALQYGVDVLLNGEPCTLKAESDAAVPLRYLEVKTDKPFSLELRRRF